MAHTALTSKLMANELPAPASLPAATTDEHYYQSVYGTLAASARGQAFLAEYARRNRHADTQILLTALDRLEAAVRADATDLARMRDGLHMLLIAIRVARPDIDAASPLTKAAKLARLLELLERRINAMAEGKTVEPDAPETGLPEESRSPLSVVPPPDEPELPIPTPGAAPQPAIALIRQDPAPAKALAVKARPGPDQAAMLNPGLPVEVRPTGPPAR